MRRSRLLPGNSDEKDTADRGAQFPDQSSSRGAKSVGRDDSQRDPVEADAAGVRSALRYLDAVTAPVQQSCEMGSMPTSRLTTMIRLRIQATREPART